MPVTERRTNPPSGVYRPRRAIALDTVAGDDQAAVRITKSGAYLQRFDIQGKPGQCGIVIEADNVSIEMDGHALTGCPGTLDGIVVVGARTSVTIKNGRIHAWGRQGVDLAPALVAKVMSLEITDNKGSGLLLGPAARVVDCLVDRNGASSLIAAPRPA